MSQIEKNWEKLCFKLKNRMLCTQLQIGSGFFAYAGRLPSVTEISQNNLEKNWLRAWRADSSGTAFGKICIKIEKCRTKAADLRRLCSTFNAIQEENIFSPLLYCNSVVAIVSSTVVSALPSLFGSMLQATDAITK